MAAKCDPDSIFLDGMEGSTGAGPHIAAANTGFQELLQSEKQEELLMMLVKLEKLH